jgi:hypothetical protein
LVITAQRDDQTLYSATASGGTANITPLTTIVASRLSSNGDPAKLASDSSAVTDAAIQKQGADLIGALEPVLKGLGVPAFNPVSDAFTANGQGPDHVLDAISVNLNPAADAAYIEITARTRPDSDSAAPLSIIFRSNTPSIPALPSRAGQNLPPANIQGMVDDLAARITACYALPTAQRVSGTTAADVIGICKALFAGNDPASFLHGGSIVGANGSFPAMFSDSGTGAKWDRGIFQYFRANGDMEVNLRAGNSGYQDFVVRNENGTLKLIGDQYRYSVAVSPVTDRYEFSNPLRFAYNFNSTGYQVLISNSGVDHAKATPPPELGDFGLGSSINFTKAGGTNYLVLSNQNGQPVGAGVTTSVRLAATWLGNPPLSTLPTPADWPGTGMYYSPTQLSDNALAALPNQSVWTVELFDANNNSLGTQTYRTVARAPTLGEFAQYTLPDFNQVTRDQIASIGGANPLSAPTSANFSWDVPDGAIAPTYLQVYSRNNGQTFVDGTTVSSAARQATAVCTGTDGHCASRTEFATGSMLFGYQLRSIDQSQRVVFRMLSAVVN